MSPTDVTSPAAPTILPTPTRLERLEGRLRLGRGIHVEGESLAPDAVDVLLTHLRRACGAGRSQAPDAVVLALSPDPSLPAEAYRIDASDGRISLSASTTAGFGWAVQTLLQLLPSVALGPGPVAPEAMTIPAIRIEDTPAYPWRGSHVDVARHFLPLDGLLRHLELMALHKLNVLHLHLTDDQGWRLPVDDYPLLTEIGGWRPGTMPGRQPFPGPDGNCDVAEHDGVPHGGAYTRADIARIVHHAARLGITVVPEVDMPGHMEAAVAAYPELGCVPVPYPRTCWGVSQHVLSLNPATLAFCRTVLDTAMDLFPGSPIHVGGDECPGVEWERDTRTRETMAQVGASDRAGAQAWFEAEVCRHVLDAGRQVIAWDEVLDGDIDPAVTIHCWHTSDQALDALRRGHGLIASPYQITYLDYDQATGPRRPVSIGGPLTLETTTRLAGFLSDCEQQVSAGGGHLLGGQTQLWTEYVRSWSRAENLLWPRSVSIAQQLWTGGEAGPADSYATLASDPDGSGSHLDRLTAMEVAWCRPEELD